MRTFNYCLLFLFSLNSASAETELFDLKAIRDSSTLEAKVIHDWKLSKKIPAIRQKLIEITVCEWWQGQKVRLPVTLNAPADGSPCKNVLVVNMGLAPKTATPRGVELELLTKHGVGVVMIGMGTIDAMVPKGELHLGMREQLLKTRDVRYTPAWIWGMSQMRALTAAVAEAEVYQPVKVLGTGGSKRGVAAAVAGIHDDRFTAILPVVAPPLGNPGGTYVLGTEEERITKANQQFFADLSSGKLGLDPSIKRALDERTQRRASSRITLEQARQSSWSDADIASITDRAWDASRVTDHLSMLRKRGTEIFYNLGTNDSVSPALLDLGRQFPDFPINIVPGGQHGGPSTAGYTRRVPQLQTSQDNLRSFALHHFFGVRDWPSAPEIDYLWDAGTHTLTVGVKFPEGIEPQSNALWWSVDRSEPFTLPFEYDHWQSTEMKKTESGMFRGKATLSTKPARLDFITVHTHTQDDLPVTFSSRYLRVGD